MLMKRTPLRSAGCGFAEGSLSCRTPGSIQLDDMLPPVGRVADEPLVDWINYKIECFEGKLPNQDGALVGQFRHVGWALAPLDRQTSRAVNLDGNGASACAGLSRPERP